MFRGLPRRISCLQSFPWPLRSRVFFLTTDSTRVYRLSYCPRQSVNVQSIIFQYIRYEIHSSETIKWRYCGVLEQRSNHYTDLLSFDPYSSFSQRQRFPCRCLQLLRRLLFYRRCSISWVRLPRQGLTFVWQPALCYLRKLHIRYIALIFWYIFPLVNFMKLLRTSSNASVLLWGSL